MGSLQRVVRNSSALMASNVLGKGIAFFSVLLAARYLGVEMFGLLAFALSFNGLFNVIMDLGFSPLIVKDIARDHYMARTYIRKILFIKVFLVFFTFALVLITTKILAYSGYQAAVIYLIFVFFVLFSFANVGYGVLRAFEAIHYVAAGEIIMSTSILAGFGLAVYAGAGVAAFSMAYVVAGLLALIYSSAVVRQVLAQSDTESHPETRVITAFTLLKSSLPFALMAAFTMILLYLDSVMLGILRTQREVGIYGVAYRSALVFGFIPLAIHSSLVPLISKRFGDGSGAVTSIIDRQFGYSLIAGVPLGVGGSLLAWSLVPAVFGPEYKEASMIFAILIWSLVFLFLRFPFVTMFEATDRQSIIARIFALATVLNVFLNALLIPFWGMMGAAIATVVTDLVIFILIMRLGIRSGACRLERGLLVRIFKVSLAAAVMGLTCMHALRFGLIFSVVTGVVVYVVMILTLKTFDDEDMDLLKKAIRP